MPKNISFRHFKTLSEIIQFAVILYMIFPLSLRNGEDTSNEQGVDVSYESVRQWWYRFGLMKALDKRVKVYQSHSYSGTQWHVIEALMRVCTDNSYGSAGTLENFLRNILWGLFRFPFTTCNLVLLFLKG